ncbi:flagellin N-terminal helical domain-containing protein [Diaphorobacter nitroreducens]|uniref:flagellin N-terminal helical domain-containing protein n=1 Tax=Diaphorobacter nitroreducens TaxID=164759 RepID=UPI002898B216|nr:flagellin [Diaphorobacter nitroreducens]
MSMIINTNIASLNAQRNTALNSSSLSTTMQRLSSGLRINSAKDDAAGLAIADRMNTQIRGMNVAVRNAGDAISMAQVAEGGLSAMNDMLQRMRELAVQASNAPNSTGASGDISKLDNEYKQLGAELSRMMSATQFNGDAILSASTDYVFQVGANAGAENQITISAADMSLTGATAFAAVASGGSSALETSAASANTANIAALDNALSEVNGRRATLGALQSRFENTIAYLRTAGENQSAARSRIMDADFAQETANLSRTQILQQAGTAMIAQANQLPQNVLKLLQG